MITTKKVYDINLMKYISLFENITRAQVEDAFLIDETVYFIIKEGFIGLAVGKGGMNFRRIEGILKKSIRIIEYSLNLSKFIQNIVYPLKIANIEINPSNVILTAGDTKTRGMLIGRGGSSLRNTETIIKRYFPIEEIKVN